MHHTLATQAINRGMSLEAIAALLGHHSMDMTLRYAKIASRTVADEYFAVTAKVEALYDNPPALPASAAGPEMARLHREMRQRMLGNGYCTRPETLDCTIDLSARPAPSSPPQSSSGPPCKPNTTTPPHTTRPAGNTSSPTYSTTSIRHQLHDHLDTDHPHNAEKSALRRGGM
jgi:hypothetical protein